jgi:Uma2 family endonuclease
LPELYYSAGIPEYWLIDALENEIDFEVFVRGPSEYEAVKAAEGWHRSPTFGREFRLERTRNPIGVWQYRLQVRLPQ